MKTAESIEAQEERKPKKKRTYRLGKNPKSHTIVGNRNGLGATERLRPYQWKPGQSGNPHGRQREDVAAKIARAVFANNEELLYKAYGKAAMKGNAYAFKELADRAFGKIKERHEIEVTQFSDVSETALIERLDQLGQQRQNFARLLGSGGGNSSNPEGTPAPPSEKAN
jgi:hypothetical protein